MLEAPTWQQPPYVHINHDSLTTFYVQTALVIQNKEGCLTRLQDGCPLTVGPTEPLAAAAEVAAMGSGPSTRILASVHTSAGKGAAGARARTMACTKFGYRNLMLQICSGNLAQLRMQNWFQVCSGCEVSYPPERCSRQAPQSCKAITIRLPPIARR